MRRHIAMALLFSGLPTSALADETARVSNLAKTGVNTGIIGVVVVALVFIGGLFTAALHGGGKRKNGQADDSESDKTDTQDDRSMGKAE